MRTGFESTGGLWGTWFSSPSSSCRVCQPGDKVIILTYATYAEEELGGHAPRVVLVDTDNKPVLVDA